MKVLMRGTKTEERYEYRFGGDPIRITRQVPAVREVEVANVEELRLRYDRFIAGNMARDALDAKVLQTGEVVVPFESMHQSEALCGYAVYRQRRT